MKSSCGCPRCEGATIEVDPSLVKKCRYAEYPQWVQELWNRYVLVVKRGNASILDCPPDMYAALEADLKAEGYHQRKVKEDQALEAFNRAQGFKK